MSPWEPTIWRARAKFYDALTAELGVGRMMENEQFIAWGETAAGIGLTKPFDGKPATVGNGVMVALRPRTGRRSTGYTIWR